MHKKKVLFERGIGIGIKVKNYENTNKFWILKKLLMKFQKKSKKEKKKMVEVTDILS